MGSNDPPPKTAIPVMLSPITGRVSRAKKGVPVHICDVCQPPKTFTRAEHLRRHQLSHRPATFPCPVAGCGKVFHRQDLLTRHEERHQQDREFMASNTGVLPQPEVPRVDEQTKRCSRTQPTIRDMDSCPPLLARDYFRTPVTTQISQGVPMFDLPKQISNGSNQWQSSNPPTRNLSDVYRQDTYNPSPVLLRGSDSPNDGVDVATDSGYASLGSNLRKYQLRNTIKSTLLEPSSSSSLNFGEDDNHTEYSYTHSLHKSELEIYISEFAEELAAVLPRSISVEQLPSLSATLPDLMKAFAIRFGLEDNSHSQYRLMYLVYKYRNQISNAVVGTFTIEEQDTEEEAQKPSDVMPVEDKILLWASKNHQLIEDPDHVVGQADNVSRDYDELNRASWDDEVGNDNDDFEYFPEIHEYRQTLSNSPAYSWLLKSVIVEVGLEIPAELDDTRGKIRRKILEFLGEPPRISQRHAPPVRSIVYNLPWIRHYLISQEYDIPIHEALPRAIVVVGVDDQSFVTTCGEYLGTLWPDIGPQILSLCISLLSSPHGFVASCTLFDKTNISAKIHHNGSTAEFYVTGTVYSLADIAEIVAWLSTAFTHDSLGHNLGYRCPTCDIGNQFVEQQWGDPKSTIVINHTSPCINFTFVESPSQRATEADSQGCCWVDLFGDRPVVSGYPIPRRTVKRTGAEIPLDLMARLVNARKVLVFSGYILIKGYSAVLVPTQRSQDIIFWHLIFDQLGGYISYTDLKVKALLKEYPEGLTRGSLETSRHVIGWCSHALNRAGTSDANYAIGWSSLKPPGPGLAFEKISIVGGMFITAGVSTIIGKRDKAVHFKTRDDYTMRLKWISKKYVVLYDVQDRRAWLLDGASALLHLVRASLQHDSNDPFKSLFLYRESALNVSLDPHGGKNAAISVLTNPRNLDIPLYAKPDMNRVEVTTHEGGGKAEVLSSTKTHYCLKDKIEDICNTLEQIIAHQADTCTQDGVGFKVKASDRRHIEGFDFMDIATDEDPCWPRQATLRSSGRGWVDFVRAIHAVTLFGTRFGDLISPSKVHTKECTSCHANVDLPKGRDLLVVCVSELQDILQKRGSTATTPWRLVDDIYWLTPDKTFESCQLGQLSPAKCDIVQVLLPATFPKLWGRNFKSPRDLTQAPRGALIFGHSRRFPLRWGDRGDPEQGHPDQDHELENLQTSMHDSGIGTSLDSSSGNDGNSPPSIGSSSLVQERTGTPIHTLEGATETKPASKRRKLNDFLSNMSR